MAIKKELEIVLDTKDANDNVNALNNSLEQTNKEVDDISKKGTKALDNTGKSAKKGSTGVKTLTKSFKGLGLALKALGIGLIISAIATLSEAFKSNQKVVDFFSTIFETLGIIFTQVTDAIIRTYEAVTSSSENFDALGKVLKGILTLALTPMKLAFYAIKLGIQQAQLAWEKSFFGDKDQNTINQLTKDIEETKQALFNVGKEAVDAGKSIVNNFGEAIDEVSEIGKTAVKELSEVSIKEANAAAKRLVDARNNAKLLAAAQQGLIEQYEIQAEQQRQLRDSDLSSIQDRKAANEELGRILEKQNEVLLKNADSLIDIARLELQRNNTIENQVALQEALNEKKAIENRIEGQRSEQISNTNRLKREALQLQESINKSELDRNLNQQKFNADQIENERMRLEELIRINQLEKELREEDLQEKIDSYKVGTQSRIDAENELKDFLQQNAQERITIENNIQKAKKKELDDELKRQELVSNAKVELAENVSNLVSQIAGKDSAVAKGVAVAQATISGIEGVQNTYTTASKSPITTLFPAYPFIQAGLAGAFSTFQIREILKTDPTGRGASPSSTGSSQATATPSAPAFNLVQGTEGNQIAESINNQNNTPTQAYVVSGEVTSQQALDRQIETRASI